MREENLCRAAFLATALHSIILPAQVVVTITVLLLGKVVCRRKSCALLHCEELWDGDAQRLDVDPYGERIWSRAHGESTYTQRDASHTTWRY